MSYQIIERGHPERHRVEQFICERYWAHFNACLSQLPKRLIGVFDGNELVAACGLQLAEEGALFSEYYLTHAISKRLFVERSKFAEIGSMAVRQEQDLPALFIAVQSVAKLLHREYLLFTVTRFLQLKLKRLGIQTTTLTAANESALPDELQQQWGNYYQQQPQVLKAAVKQSWPTLRNTPTKPLLTQVAL